MNRFLSTLLVTAWAGTLIPVAAHAQNVAATPTYGTLNLTVGFTPDPQTKRVLAGGDDRVERGGCRAYIHAAAPDIDLNYTAGSLPLSISVRSEVDVVLLVNTPDGRWHCDDDSGGGTDALLVFSPPRSGNYNIWVGTYEPRAGALQPAMVHISEVARTGSPAAGSSTPARRDNLQSMRVCVVVEGTLQEIDAQYNPATGDTTLLGRPFREVHPAGAEYGASAAWYVDSEPITVGRRRFTKFGLPRVLGPDEISPLARHRGVRVFGEAGVRNPDIVYVPVRPGCEFQPYQVVLRG